MTEKNSNILLVQGVWSDGSIWREVITILAHQGFHVTAAQIPLTSFEEDVAAINRALDYQEAPVVLVGHSLAEASSRKPAITPRSRSLFISPRSLPSLGKFWGQSSAATLQRLT